MAQQIRFFRGNRFDETNGGQISFTVGDWDATARIGLDRRSNTYAIGADAVPTLSQVSYSLGGGDSDVNRIFIINHNFASNQLNVAIVDINDVQYTIVNAGVVNNLTPAGDITILNDGESTLVSLENLLAIKQVRVGNTTSSSPSTGSFFRFAQVIATQELGQLEGYPVVSNNAVNRNITDSQSASGRRFIKKNFGGWSARLSVGIWNISADLTLIQNLYTQSSGFLVWVNAGDSAQFSNPLEGFRFEDIYYVKPTNPFNPQKYKGLYTSGYRINMDVAETLY